MAINFLLRLMLIIINIGCAKAIISPGRPRNVSLLADDRNIAVQWEPPTETGGNIRRYIVTWAILPDFGDVVTNNTEDGNDTISFIAIKDNIGRLFRIRVRAENNYGVSAYSVPRYIRIGCGNDVNVSPNGVVSITSPGFDAQLALKSGVICKWIVATDSIYVLKFKIGDMNLFNNTLTNCAEMLTYVNVSTVGLFCKAKAVGQEITTQQSSVTVTLMTGNVAGGGGFSMLFTTAVKRPGPPVNITTKVTDHAILVAWQQPMERTLPITSYAIRYKILPDGHAYMIVVAPSMRSFPINTDRWMGKLLSFNITAKIQNLDGHAASNVYARATCQKQYYLQPDQTVNITSPNYPDVYPRSIVCVWTMRCSPEATLRMTYYDFKLEDLPFCSGDYIQFSYKREPECARIKVPHVYDTGLQEINITFVTNNVRQHKGFLINFSAKAFTSYLPQVSSTETSLPSSLILPTLYSKMPSNNRKLLESQNVRGPDAWKTVSEERKHSLVTTTSRDVVTNKDSRLRTLNSRPIKPLSAERLLEWSTSSSIKQSFDSSTDSSMNKSITYGPISTFGNVFSTQSLTNTSSIRRITPSIFPKRSSTVILVSSASRSDVSLQTAIVDQTFEQKSAATVLNYLNVNRNLVTSDKFGSSRGSIESSENKYVQKGKEQERARSILAPVLLSAAGSLTVVCIVAYLICRRKRRQRKINPESIRRYKAGHIELHDILQESHHTGGCGGIFKTMSSRDLFGKAQPRKRHSTFPLYCSIRKRKVHREIQRQMVEFGSFIEDKQALETRLRRRHAHRRTNSF